MSSGSGMGIAGAHSMALVRVDVIFDNDWLEVDEEVGKCAATSYSTLPVERRTIEYVQHTAVVLLYIGGNV